MAKKSSDNMATIVSLCKRRGFIFQSSEIYGGLNGCWDYGPLGVELLNNVKQAWWRTMTLRPDVEGVDAAILMHPRVWEASGHVENFSDPMVDCKQCRARFRLDNLLEELSLKKKKSILRALEPETYAGQQQDQRILDDFAARTVDEDAMAAIVREHVVCPSCGASGTFTDARQFNLMFKTHVGPMEDTSSAVYLRPETAQGIFVNFLNVLNSSRQRLPFGIAQIGKAFRNEITPGNFVFRTREFEQAEMQFFVKPGTDAEWFERWKAERMAWHESLGIREENLRFHEHTGEELAHYAKKAFDIEYRFPFGWKEFEGIHNRTDFDLKRHQEYSGKRLEYIDAASSERYIPYVIETSMGVDRTALVVLADAYREEQVEGEERVVLALHPRLSPLKAAVFPLVKKDGLPEIAARIHEGLRKAALPSFYDEAGSIGRRYRRQDEAGTPWCVTVDGQTNEDGTVTIRDRDTLQQARVGADQVVTWVRERLGS